MAARAPAKLLVGLAVAGLLAIHAALALWAASGKSTTADELIHITGGYAYWHLDDYRLHPENGILPQRWAALPAVFMRPPFPKLEGNPYWKTSEVQAVGHQFFYETGHDHFPMLMAGRAMIVLFNLATGVLIFCWSRRLFGTAAAFLSLSLFVFSPNFLAHGALATSDACMTFFFLASVGAWWRHLHDGRARWWWLSAVAFGFAWVAKYSAVLLLPMMVLLALWRAFTPAPLTLAGRTFTTRAGKFGAAALSALGHGAVAAGVIWASYGFHYAAFNPALPAPDHFILPWETINASIGFPGKVLSALAGIHALPEAFLYGFAYVIDTAGLRSAFLNGDYSVTGWVSFFPWAFALKTTLPVLAVTAAVGALAARRWLGHTARAHAELYRIAPLVVLFVVYWMFSLTSHLNIGHRHILPTYPVLFIAAGALVAWCASRRGIVLALIGGLAGGQASEATGAAPHFLAYFNVLGGGPANGHRHLVDSSLDWGQDLPGLKAWLDANRRDEPVYLSYFGTGEPDYYGIKAHRLPFVNAFKIPQPYVRLEPGTYAISATMLSHVYSPLRGPWTLGSEKEFQELRGIEHLFADYVGNAQRRAEMNRDAPEVKWRRTWTKHDILRFARLCHYLRVRAPDATVGHSILIYRLTAAEIGAATAGSLGDWQKLIERAVSLPASR
jgi:hypothetical protein